MRKPKSMMVVLAITLAAALGVSGTIAWLTDESDTVTNTFTVGNIDIKLDESKLQANGELNTSERVIENEYKMVPGTTLPKDPLVTVFDGSEDCYVFVQVRASNNTITGLEGNILTYSVDVSEDGWKLLNGESDVYYQEITGLTESTNTSDWTDYVLDGNEVATNYGNGFVTVNENLTKSMMDAIETRYKEKYDEVYNDEVAAGKSEADAAQLAADAAAATYPTLSFKAFAVQKANIADVSAAWSKIPASEKL